MSTDTLVSHGRVGPHPHANDLPKCPGSLRVMDPAARIWFHTCCAVESEGTMMTNGEGGSPLQWKTLTKKRQSSTRGIPPGTESLNWVANTVVLIYGARAAVLVDTFLSADHTRELIDWIRTAGKNLTTIYVTHAHGDHFFGIGMVEDAFPTAKAVATAETIAGMHRQISPEFMAAVWNPRFPGQLPDRLTVAEEIRSGGIDLEGHTLVPVRLGHTDT